MSVNLEFANRNDSFPFQTPTTLTYEVLNASTINEKLNLLDKQMKSWKWTAAERASRLNSIRRALESGNTLTAV